MNGTLFVRNYVHITFKNERKRKVNYYYFFLLRSYFLISLISGYNLDRDSSHYVMFILAVKGNIKGINCSSKRHHVTIAKFRKWRAGGNEIIIFTLDLTMETKTSI